MSRSGRDLAWLSLVALVLFVTHLGTPPLWDRDEPRNAGCAAEMATVEDWVVPTFNAELRGHKPVFLYWCMMAAYRLFGVNEFAARLPSALAGLATVWLTYGIGCRLSDRRGGLWAGLILATTIMFGVASRAATPDALLILCGTAAITCYVRGTFPADRDQAALLFPTHYPTVLAMYACMAVGVLTKGPVGLVVPTAVLGMVLLCRRLPARQMPGWAGWLRHSVRVLHPGYFLRTCWSMRPLTALAVTAVVAGPWYVWVHLRTQGAWTAEFFWTHNVSRATSALEGHAGPPVLFYVATILVGCFPWSVLTIPTALHVAREAPDDRGATARTLLLCWVGVYVGLFSLAQTKLPSYITPCYPALALFVAHYVASWREAVCHPGWVRVGLAHLVGVGVLLIAGLGWAAHTYLPGSEWLAAIGLAPLLGGVCAWWWLAQPRRMAVCLAGTALAIAFCLQVLVPTEIGRHQAYGPFLKQVTDHAVPLASLGQLEPSWVVYSGQPIQEFSVEDQAALLAFWQQHPQASVITTEESLEEAFGSARDAFTSVASAEYFLRDRKLLLVQPKPEALPRIASAVGLTGNAPY